VDPVRHVAHRNLALRPAREEVPEELAAHCAVEAAHPVERAAATDGEVGHVEGFGRIIRVLPSECQEIVETDPQAFLGIWPEVPLNEGRVEAVEAGRHRRVRGEDVSRARDRQGHVEGAPALLHEGPGALEHRERRVPLVEVADLGLEPEGPQQAPAPDAQHQLLLQAQLGASAVQLARDGAEGRRVRGVVAVEQVERAPSDLRLPRPEPDRVPRQRKLQAQPLPAFIPDRADRELPGVVVGVQRFLAAIGANHLTEVALLVEEPDADHRNTEVTRGLELVPGHVAEPA